MTTCKIIKHLTSTKWLQRIACFLFLLVAMTATTLIAHPPQDSLDIVANLIVNGFFAAIITIAIFLALEVKENK